MKRGIFIFALIVFAFFLSIFEGPVSLTLEEIMKGSPIFWKVRLPRVVHAFVVGASLSLSGSTLQAIFRNPLAEPFLLGISAGAAVGAALSVLLNIKWGLEAFSFVGSLLSFYLVFKISIYNGLLLIERLLLAGIAINALLSALLGFLIYLMRSGIHGLLFWFWGNLGLSSWDNLLRILPIFIISLAVILRYSEELNLILWGDEHAYQMGVNSEKVKRELIVFSSLLAAISVASSGIIGFVGLITPHIVRLSISPDYRKLLPLSAILGGAFLIFADTLSRVLIPPAEVPVGIITALCGSPFFIYLLKKRGKGNA